MDEIPRISVEEARRKVVSKQAILVCAYEDEVKCNRMKLEGAINLSDLRSMRASLGKDKEIIFYCA